MGEGALVSAVLGKGLLCGHYQAIRPAADGMSASVLSRCLGTAPKYPLRIQCTGLTKGQTARLKKGAGSAVLGKQGSRNKWRLFLES